jgi:hypothetical protein
MESFVAPLDDRLARLSVRGDGDQVSVLFAKSILYLVKNRPRFIPLILAKIDRYRIEDVSQDAWKTMREDFETIGLEPGTA